jgi:hypothetical protein
MRSLNRGTMLGIGTGRDDVAVGFLARSTPPTSCRLIAGAATRRHVPESPSWAICRLTSRPCAAPQLCQSLAADHGYNEPSIATLLGHKAHSITSRYVHSADAVLLAAADAVANATMKLMASDQAQPQLRDQGRDGSVVWDEFTSL